MCTQKPPPDYSAELYSRYGLAFSAYITERVLPALRGHSGEFLLNELWQRWANHKLMVRWLSRFFNYLDRYYIARHTMHPLPEVGLMRFRDEVYNRVKLPAKEALLAAVANERAGEGVNRPLLKNVLSIFIEVGMGSMDCYQRDFEASLVEATKEHYARVAAAWVRKKKFFFGFFSRSTSFFFPSSFFVSLAHFKSQNSKQKQNQLQVEGDSCPEYMAKAEAALRSEEERVDAYLHASSRSRLMAGAEQALLASHAETLLNKEGSGVSSLLADGRRDDLARMYRLFVRVPRGLDPVAAAFRAHVEGKREEFLEVFWGEFFLFFSKNESLTPLLLPFFLPSFLHHHLALQRKAKETPCCAGQRTPHRPGAKRPPRPPLPPAPPLLVVLLVLLPLLPKRPRRRPRAPRRSTSSSATPSHSTTSTSPWSASASRTRASSTRPSRKPSRPSATRAWGGRRWQN